MRIQPENRPLEQLTRAHWWLPQLGHSALEVVLVAAIALATLSLSRPVTASETPIVLTAGEAEVQGVTSGQFSFLQLAARDRRRKLCLGYGRRNPDYILELTERQPQLSIAVESNGGDTTLLIQGPRGIDCNDNYRREHQDAAVTAENWPPGTYRIWVGAFNRGDRLDYSLRVFDPEAASD
ncbi:MAG: hypothetical protein WBB01_14735 [Phormidesmis sp.]